MDGGLGRLVRSEIAKTNLYAFEKMFDNGFREVTNSEHPIQTPDDLRGLKLRVPPSPLSTSLFTAFGASPVSITFSEVYTALQTHLVVGQENPLALIETSKFYEVQKYVSMTNHQWDGFWALANVDGWRRLPVDLQRLVTRHLNGAAEAQRGDVEKLNATLSGTLRSRGLAFNTPPRDPFRAKLKAAGFYQEWRRRFGSAAWAVLERYAGRLT
jgi:tripartite ATP-independent transporter DctP family solute receptor